MKEKAVYAPGELDRVRSHLGVMDDKEAKRMAQILGGEVGHERAPEEERNRYILRQAPPPSRTRGKPSRESPRRVLRRIELSRSEEEQRQPPSSRRMDLAPEDDPEIPLKIGYFERIKMDRYAGFPEFDIKSPFQVLRSILTPFWTPPDYVSPMFVLRRIKEYYKPLETLVASTRSMLPRRNFKRNEWMKKTSPFVYNILNTIRCWNIEKISGDIARIQLYPRSARVEDFAEILKEFYRPLFILERLDFDTHIREAYKILYKALYIENPIEAEKYQSLIRNALAAYREIRKDIQFLLYPLLMKLVSPTWLPYERFFSERRNRLMTFLGLNEDAQIPPAQVNAPEKDPKESEETEESEKDQEGLSEEDRGRSEKETQERRATREAEEKALQKGLDTLEALFPQAGWDRLADYPDLYPYFADVFNLKREVVNIAPTDPLQQVLILMRILGELLYGLRHASFYMVSATHEDRLDRSLDDIVNDWYDLYERSFEKEYLPRLEDYVRILEGPSKDKASPYAKRLLAELNWLKRLYFLPYYKFDTVVQVTIPKRDITPIFNMVRRLRKNLTFVAAGIEEGIRNGGAAQRASCEGINNPWDPWVFQVANPLSKRLTALLSPKNRNNASLVIFTLAVATVLDYLLNNVRSWAYREPSPLFRSQNGDGITPLTGEDQRIDAEAIFNETMNQRRQQKQAEAGGQAPSGQAPSPSPRGVQVPASGAQSQTRPPSKEAPTPSPGGTQTPSSPGASAPPPGGQNPSPSGGTDSEGA